MTALIVIACILLALLLIGQLRVGAAVAYSEAGLFVKVKAGPVRIQILPAKERKKKKEKKPNPYPNTRRRRGRSLRLKAGKRTPYLWRFVFCPCWRRPPGASSARSVSTGSGCM